MPSFELNKLQSISGVSAVAGAERAKAKAAPDARAAPGDAASGTAASGAGVSVEVETRLETQPPVDTDRVAEIRSALREGTYPLVPAKIADAMIAAQLNFEVQ